MRSSPYRTRKTLLKKLKLKAMAAKTDNKHTKTLLQSEPIAMERRQLEPPQVSFPSTFDHHVSVGSSRGGTDNRLAFQESIINDRQICQQGYYNVVPAVTSDNFTLNYPNIIWPTAYPPQTYVWPNTVVSVPLSDFQIAQQNWALISQSNYSARNDNYYNRYPMYRSPDSSNQTNAAERDRLVAQSLRAWQLTPLGGKCRIASESSLNCYFTVLSFNVLAQELLTGHPYLYRNHMPRALLWEQRWANILHEIRTHNADIMCLQEVQSSHVESYYSELNKLGYDGIFKQRTGIRTDGCAIYFKASVFDLVEYTTVEFNQSNVQVLDRDNVAIIAKLAPKNNRDNEFVVATTHLLYNPRREDVRLAQTQLLLTEIDRMSFTKKNNVCANVPIIITGDFNLMPSSPVYELITRGYLRYEDLIGRSLTKTNSTNIIGKTFLPSSLRITDECRHADLLELREKEGTISREQELGLIQLQHSERISNNKCSKHYNSSLFSTGALSHHLALKSAYEHRQGDQFEATTFQDGWVNVDYIFYSGIKDQNNLIQDDKLKLLYRYTIPTNEQLQGMTIPNFAFGSDHLSLVVRFKLEP